ncbi:MAG: hypothetical protein AB7V06_06715 [Candidatus Obscuribacterales bacterium]
MTNGPGAPVSGVGMALWLTPPEEPLVVVVAAPTMGSAGSCW